MAPQDETEYRLEAFARVTLGASGSGNQINVGPRLPGERWKITGFSATGTSVAKLQIMRGNSFDASRQVDVTVRADADSSDTQMQLMTGESLSFWWTAGANGATMTCSIEGSRFVPGRRAY
jgi:hypothetical protein